MPISVDFTNQENFKPCIKKEYSIYACIPPKGTIIINRLEQIQDILSLREEFNYQPLYCAIYDYTWFREPTEEIKMRADAGDEIAKDELSLYSKCLELAKQGHAMMVDEERPIVMEGTGGEFWLVNMDTFAKKYVFQDRSKITEEKIEEKKKDGSMDWTRVISVPNLSKAFACFVPIEQQGSVLTPAGTVLNFNAPGAPHGRGDFVIANCKDGKPDMSDMWVVNGKVFKDTYSCP